MTLPKDPIKREAYLKALRERPIGKKHSIETKAKMSASRKGKPKSEETKKKMSIAKQGIPRPEYVCDKISKGRIGKYAGEKHPLYGKHHSTDSRNKMRETNIKTWENQELRNKISENNRGENNGSYIDGRLDNYPLYISIRGCTKMREWRRKVYRRDYFTCQLSGIKGKPLEPHHIKSLSDICHENNIKTFEEAMECEALWDMSNGITLEKKLHRSLHAQYGKQIPVSLFRNQYL